LGSGEIDYFLSLDKVISDFPDEADETLLDTFDTLKAKLFYFFGIELIELLSPLIDSDIRSKIF